MSEHQKLNLWSLGVLFLSLAITGVAFSMSISTGVIAVVMWLLGAIAVAIGRIIADEVEGTEKPKRGNDV